MILRRLAPVLLVVTPAAGCSDGDPSEADAQAVQAMTDDLAACAGDAGR